MRGAGERRASGRTRSGPAPSSPAQARTELQPARHVHHDDEIACVAHRYEALLHGVARRILGDEDQARSWYDRAIHWMAANETSEHDQWFRREATRLFGED